MGKSLKHIGFIMDGNGRWATAKGEPRTYGHKQGAKALEELIKFLSKEDDLEQASFYCFSTENWGRPDYEVKALMNMLGNFIKKDVYKLFQEKISVKILGDLSESSPFKEDLRKELIKINSTKIEDPIFKVNFCVNYGGRNEIVRAANNLLNSNLEITEENLTKEILQNDLPLDLIVRTSGEQRLSNFLLWQSAYAELLFVDYHWPDITSDKYLEIKNSFLQRDRRFGKLK